jgi:hypothetical protein
MTSGSSRRCACRTHEIPRRPDACLRPLAVKIRGNPQAGSAYTRMPRPRFVDIFSGLEREAKPERCACARPDCGRRCRRVGDDARTAIARTRVRADGAARARASVLVPAACSRGALRRWRGAPCRAGTARSRGRRELYTGVWGAKTRDRQREWGGLQQEPILAPTGPAAASLPNRWARDSAGPRYAARRWTTAPLRLPAVSSTPSARKQ